MFWARIWSRLRLTYTLKAITEIIVAGVMKTPAAPIEAIILVALLSPPLFALVRGLSDGISKIERNALVWCKHA